MKKRIFVLFCILIALLLLNYVSAKNNYFLKAGDESLNLNYVKSNDFDSARFIINGINYDIRKGLSQIKNISNFSIYLTDVNFHQYNIDSNNVTLILYYHYVFDEQKNVLDFNLDGKDLRINFFNVTKDKSTIIRNGEVLNRNGTISFGYDNMIYTADYVLDPYNPQKSLNDYTYSFYFGSDLTIQITSIREPDNFYPKGIAKTKFNTRQITLIKESNSLPTQCTNECNWEGDKFCTNGINPSYKTCGYYDADPCLDYSINSITCNNGDICVDGQGCVRGNVRCNFDSDCVPPKPSSYFCYNGQICNNVSFSHCINGGQTSSYCESSLYLNCSLCSIGTCEEESCVRQPNSPITEYPTNPINPLPTEPLPIINNNEQKLIQIEPKLNNENTSELTQNLTECNPIGLREKGKFCSIEHTWLIQKEDGKFCRKNYECFANKCIKESCGKNYNIVKPYVMGGIILILVIAGLIIYDSLK